TAVSTVMRVSWRTVGKIIARVMARKLPPDLLEGVTRIGIDELSVRRHHEYITAVTNHATGKAIWAKPGRKAATEQAFFDELPGVPPVGLRGVTVRVSAAEGGAWGQGAQRARHVCDRVHRQRVAHDAVDQDRREHVRVLKGTEAPSWLKKTRFGLQKNPWH